MALTPEDAKVLIFVVAYNAEKTIQQVLRRIPVGELPPHTDVLVIDDSSADSTFALAQEFSAASGGINIKVLYNPENQGYGGNQKIGYAYAIEQGYDIVVLLHGDGQYAPEKMPDLIQPLLDDQADACFGSRMMERGAALRDGMPRYKYIGNRILTWFENRVLGTDLSEFHSGYRAYRVDALRKVPFRYNTNDFHFDTDIIIQFVLGDLRIKEVKIPTYYGDEICHVNGMLYAVNVVLSVLGSKVSRWGILYQRRFDVSSERVHYPLKQGYESSHTVAANAVRSDSEVLDLACGPGGVAGLLKSKGCHVTGVDLEQADDSSFDKFIQHDLNSDYLPQELGTYDTILLLDAIEHFARPERFMELLRDKCYAERTNIIITTPNIAVLPMRISLLLGQFNYGPRGILDLTHTRLFTFRSLKRMLREEGYEVLRVQGIPAPFPEAVSNGMLGRTLLEINRFMIALWPSMFAYQIFVEARFRPPLANLLELSMRRGNAVVPDISAAE